MEALEGKIWWQYLGEDLQKLLYTSMFLLDTIHENQNIHDYSFIAFPAAKAYEGFLKKLFLGLKFISEDDYYGKHFRIGKALNPSLPREMEKESIYHKIVQHCGGPKLAETLWQTWKESRNLIFHWFPNEKNTLTLPEARDRVEMVILAIDTAFKDCNSNLSVAKMD